MNELTFIYFSQPLTMSVRQSSVHKVSDGTWMSFFFYKQSIFDPHPQNCLSFSKKSPQKIVQQLFSRWSVNFYCLNIQIF